MNEEQREGLKNILLQSLYDFHIANDGASYHLPIAMVNTDPESKLAIESLIKSGYAEDSGQGQGTESLILAITPKGIEYIENK